MADNDNELPFPKVGMVGVGSMGSMMSLLLAEYGHHVFCFDPNSKNIQTLQHHACNLNLTHRITITPDLPTLARALPSSRLVIISTPHGSTIDSIIDTLHPQLQASDVILDCANEHFSNTERRQSLLSPDGIHYMGCGVSGGYQSARSGPSFSPGGDADALDLIMPFLSRLAAKDTQGRPCVKPVGPGGSGHYVKMVHNGIEQGMMSILAEGWMVMVRGLGMSEDEVKGVLRGWNERGPLRGCYLVGIGADAARREGGKVLEGVRDKVVQDVDETEGTGTWTCEEVVRLHVPAATIVCAHLFRCASADAVVRMREERAAGGGVETARIDVGGLVKEDFVRELEMAVYFCFLTCFAQGLNLLHKANKAKGWGLVYGDVLQLWRSGSIIQADGVLDVLDAMYGREDHDPDDVLANREVGSELSRCYEAIKDVVVRSVQANLFVPAISQSLEFYKYSTSTDLPTQFMEAQLDYFGQHMFERKDDPQGPPKTGPRHFEWKPARGPSGN